MPRRPDPGRRSPFPDTILAMFEVGIDPVGIAIHPSGEYIYVTARYDDVLCVVRTSDRRIVSRVAVGRRPHAVCVLPDGSQAYVANCGSNDVAVVNLPSHRVVGRIEVGRFPIHLAPSPDGSSVYLTNRESGELSVISTRKRAVVATLGVGPFPWGIAVQPDGERVFVARSNEDSVLAIRTSDLRLVDSIRVSFGPEGMALAAGGSRLYVACHAGAVDVVDLSNDGIVASIPMDGYPVAVASLPNGEYVYATTYAGGRLKVIAADGNRVVCTIGGGRGPNYMAAGPDGRTVYVCESHVNRVWVVGDSPRPRPARP